MDTAHNFSKKQYTAMYSNTSTVSDHLFAIFKLSCAQDSSHFELREDSE